MDTSIESKLSELARINILDDVCLGRRSGSEENIKIKVIIPLLNLLGYDTTKDMDFEHHVANKKADIALMIDRRPKVIIETKSLDKKLEDHKVQALDYGRKKGISWVALSNGKEFQVYKSFIEDVPDPKNRPIFLMKLERLPHVFVQLLNLIGKENIRQIEKKTVTKIEAIRRAVTEDELLQTMKEAKLKIFYSVLSQFSEKFSKDLKFKEKVEKWARNRRVDTKKTWIDTYKSDKNFRDLINRILERKLNNNWFKNYHDDGDFREKTNRTLRDNDIQIDWKDKLCAEGAYTFVNRILFLRICEDRGFISVQTHQDWLNVMERAKFGDTVKSLIRELFSTISTKFITYSKPLFDHVTIEELEWKKEDILEIIKRTKKLNFGRIDRDIIGAVYQRHITQETRRRLGQFYTPEPIIEHILAQIPLNPKMRILDPACGSGGFLISVYNILRKSMLDEGYDPKKIHEHLLENVLHAIDIDSFATQLTAMNLLLKDLENPTDAINVIEANSLKTGLDQYSGRKPIQSLKAETEKSKRIVTPAKILKESSYDVVVGNPPYVSVSKSDPLYRVELQSYYKSVHDGIVNSASLFVKRGIDLLEDGGYLGFVVPKSLLRVHSFNGIRKYILEKSQIISISDIGLGFKEVGYEVIALVLRKQSIKNKEHSVKIITTITDLTSGQFESYSIPQFLFTETGVFAIYLSDELRPIVQKMKKDSTRLGTISDIWRGLPISINSPLILDLKQSPQDEQILRGKDIGRFETKGNCFINLSHEEAQKYFDAAERLRCRKIVVQNIVTSRVRCVGTYDENSALNIDTVTNVKITDSHFVDKYVLAIMNSKLGTFYIRDVIFNRATLTMHMDAPYLGQLPIREASIATQKKFRRLVDKIISVKKDLSDIGYDLYTSPEFIEKERKKAEGAEFGT